MMNNPTFAQLCAEFAALTEDITRLSSIPPQYRPDEHPYTLEQQRARRDEVTAEIKRRIQEAAQ